MNAYLINGGVGALGIAIVLLVWYDFIATVLTATGGGPLTGRATAWLWRQCLRVHRRRPAHRLLGAAGPALSVATLLAWGAALWLGWTLIFCADANAVVAAEDDRPADVVTRAYYAGYTLTTLGLGDYQPGTGAWRIATVLMAANGLFLITMAITYIMPVVGAAAERRRLAIAIRGLGDTPQEIVVRAWRDDRFATLGGYLQTLAPMIAAAGQQHLAYPIVHYFHNSRSDAALAVQLATLAEALLVLREGVAEHARPPASVLSLCGYALTSFLDSVDTAHLQTAAQAPPRPTLDGYRGAGIPLLDDNEFGARAEHYDDLRRRLLALLRGDGWRWRDAV